MLNDSIISRLKKYINPSGPDDCWEWSGPRCKIRKGKTFAYGDYGQIYVYQNGKRKALLAHRMAWEFFNDASIPDGMLVIHSCDNAPCCNPRHLRIGTSRDNSLDRVSRGRGAGFCPSDQKPRKNRRYGRVVGLDVALRIHSYASTIRIHGVECDK